MVIDVSVGDVLLLPAGYSHRALRDSDGFSMIGSYPAKHPHSWDSEFRPKLATQRSQSTYPTDRLIDRLSVTSPSLGFSVLS